MHRLVIFCLVAATAAFTLPAVARADPTNCDVVIVGAGVAGLGAASVIQNENASLSVCVLEGRGRLGGRVYSTQSSYYPDMVLEMGASWIHGIDENPIYELAQKFSIATVPTDYSAMAVSIVNESRWLAPTELIEGVATAAFFLETVFEDIPNDIDVETLYQGLLANIPAETLKPASRRAGLEFLVAGREMGSACSARELSALYGNYSEEFAYEGAQVVFPKGYSQIVDVLRQDASTARFFLETDVVSVSQTDALVTVTASDGRVFTAPQAIVTVPLAVLKANHIQFTPALPQDKLTAIQRMGSGSFHKTYLVFDHAFWGNDSSVPSDTFIFVRYAPGSEQAKAPFAARLFPGFFNGLIMSGRPMLMAANVGDNARVLADYPLAEVTKLAMQALQEMFPHITVPQPVEVVVNAWDKDPFALGAYSFSKVGALPEDAKTLSAPVGRVHFAGEASSYEYPGYVHGAFATGARAALEVLESQ